MLIYEPAEDSHLLQKYVREYAFGRVLDMGTGSGIQGLTAIENPNVREVIAVDINKNAVNQLNLQIKEKRIRKIKVVHGNLFDQIYGAFNLIVFNPPYLPQDDGIVDSALYGGKQGYELTELFLNQASKYLLADGKILLLFSTLTNKPRIEEIIQNNLFEFKELGKQKIPFETLFVYEISKSSLLRELERRGLRDVHYFAKGKRGFIYKAILDKNSLIKTHFPSKKNLVNMAIKIKNPTSEANNRINNEITWLKTLNKHGIGPKLIMYETNYLAYEFVNGEFILDWIKNKSKRDIQKVLQETLKQCYVLDKIGVNKEEMHHPLKHILVTLENKPVLIDFERCSKTDRPKNVTQFVEFLARIKKELVGFNFKPSELRKLAEEYKDTYSQNVFVDIVNNIV